MIKKIFINFLIIAILISLIFSKYIKFLEFKGVLPDFILVLTVLNGFYNGSMFGMLFGFFAGLSYDISTHSLVGFYALLYSIIGYLTFLSKYIYIDNTFVSTILIFIYNLIKCFLFLFLGFIFLESDNLLNFFRNRFLVETAYTILISIPMFLTFKYIYSKSRKKRLHV